MEARMPTLFVIFGVTGDLSRRKLIPALFHLYQRGLLPQKFTIVGFSRQGLSQNDFQHMVGKIVGPSVRRSVRNEFVKLFSYERGMFEGQAGYRALAKRIQAQDDEWGVCANKLFYLAVPPKYYRTLLTHLNESGLTKPCSAEEGWTRVIVEKPFGRDLKSAQALDALLGKLFREEQIYRIDHYLGHETVQNILAFRFANAFFQPLWDNNSIEEIHVELLETSGVEERGAFYDGVGALRDVGQNHILQLLALMTMEHPLVFEASSIRQKRAEILQALRIPSRADVAKETVRGQYEGYRRIAGVSPDSTTETYFRIRTSLKTPRWQGVPIILESGKKLDEARGEVRVTFRHPRPCLCPAGQHQKNVLRYQIRPDEGIRASFWVKRPGEEMQLEEKDFSFDYHRAYPKRRLMDAYEKLVLDAIAGDQTLFVGTDEIMASWRFVDPIVRAWEENATPLVTYTPGSQTIREQPFSLSEQRAARRELGYVGLGKMGRNMTERLAERGWHVVAYDADEKATREAATAGIATAASLGELVAKLQPPRLVWVMVPHAAVDDVLRELAKHLSRGDTVIDGGNSRYELSQKRAQKLKRRGIHYLDVGVSGGPAGARHGASIMVGGERNVYEAFEHLFRDLAVPGGYGYMGTSGAGHFVKMVHNGIEYGMMQSLAEGFAVMEKAPFRLDLSEVSRVYSHGSVIASRLVSWLHEAFGEYGQGLRSVSGSPDYTGEGQWIVAAAKKLKVPVPVIEKALRFRVWSGAHPNFSGRVISALRNKFGGHDIRGRSKTQKPRPK